VHDFVAAWTKVMELDRFDLTLIPRVSSRAPVEPLWIGRLVADDQRYRQTPRVNNGPDGPRGGLTRPW
jgi:hypothetical protein